MRKTLPKKDTLAAHLAAGMTPDHIAETYGCRTDSTRRKLRQLGLIGPITKTHPNHVERRMGKSLIDCAQEPGVVLRDDRITFNREVPWQGTGMRIRPISLARPSMYLAAIAKRYPSLQGGAHASL